MKDLDRLRTLIKEPVELVLNQQIKMEMVSSSKYLAMAGWCDRNGYDHSAGFFYKQSEEERKHAMKLFHYLCDQGATAYSPDVPPVGQEFDTLRSVFESALDQEIAVTDSINRIIGVCRREGDYATEELMKWYVKEQVEEEYIARRCLELIDQIPADQVYYLDKKLASVTYDENPFEDE
ncbi:ferritin [Spirosoma lacussanchae]|uniref:Ferritin n=1 Tax=Spirosoma sordidisoli TaxID=2502893 RepID=A0A4Q2UKP1_9BACT|nr:MULTISPECIES: ferritin [Spirosoma]RYC68211.1 ferritin [Spirosoma sordidisoli]